jgi:hypothetical protein
MALTIAASVIMGQNGVSTPERERVDDPRVLERVVCLFLQRDTENSAPEDLLHGR